jgi:hypothetical protein
MPDIDRCVVRSAERGDAIFELARGSQPRSK